jgi:glyoxylase-like metal-dependent hydrolase (beta-lactamase superfamily II)
MTAAAAVQPTERRTDWGAGETVADGVHRFDDGIVNWYLVEGESGLTAIDAGFPPAWNTLIEAIARLGRPSTDLEAVVLTHAHVDHLGFAERARRELGATVWCHPKDAPLLRPWRIARSESSPLLFARHAATRALVARALRTRAPAAKRVGAFAGYGDGDELPVPGHPRAVFCPGHTDGHCALQLRDRDVLFTGDALVTRDPYTGRAGATIVAPAATRDTAAALRTLDAIASTGARTLLPGHGEPWRDGAAEAVIAARAAGVPRR